VVESFGLLNDIFRFPSILDAGYIQFLTFIWQMSCLITELYAVIFWNLLVTKDSILQCDTCGN